jgi:hypothetical protein
MTWRRGALVLALLVVLSGCGPVSFGVGMQKILSDILFGQPKPRPTPVQSPETPLPPIFLPPAPLSLPANPCPSAPLGTPAQKEAEVNVDNPPQNGVYRWMGTYKRSASSAVFHYGVVSSEFENRLIEQSTNLGDYPATPLQGQPDHHFQFTTVQPDPYVAGDTEVITFTEQTYSPVNYNAALLQNNFDPNGGIDITDIKRLDPKGRIIEEFAPVKNGTNGNGVGVLIFALPLPAGNSGNTGLPAPDAPSSTEFSWEYASTDPVSQWTIRIAASEANKRVRVDACGQIVEGWPVSANVLITKNDPATGVPYAAPLAQTWNFVIAPQYGGIIVQESISGDAGNGATISTTEQLASMDWPPLPKTAGGT